MKAKLSTQNLEFSTRHFLPLLLLALALSAPSSRAAVIFPEGATWKFRLGTSEASAPVTAWRGIIFDDSTWPGGAAPIGYDTGGTPGTTLPIATTTPTSTAGGFLSIYFRKTFVVTNLAEIITATLAVTADDGAVAWLNGTEVGRVNVAAGEQAYNSNAVGAAEANVITTASIASLLVAGTNVIAVHAFNANSTSSDLVMDATLTTTVDDPPGVESSLPSAGAIVTSLTFINVMFTEPVSGVEAGDLRINGTPAASLLVVSPREYQFNFPQPATGAVAVAWGPAHGIADVDGAAQAFTGGGWNYTLDPNVVTGNAIISEFLAENEHGAEDEDGSRSDWVEIYNTTGLDLNLQGWFLTDSLTNLTQWRFPAVNLGPNKYLLVWASEKNRTNPAGPLHTNFKLAGAGGTLALVNAATNVVSSFAPYPAQAADNSYGRDRVDPNLTGYFILPTPGAQNATNGAGFAPGVVFSLAGGIYTNDTLSLTLSAPGASSVRYTTDGTEPVSSSTLYAGPVTVAGCTVVKARAFQAGLWPGPVGSGTFILLDATMAGFSSDIPILVMTAPGTIPSSVVPGGARRRGALAVVDTFRGRAALTGRTDFLGPAQFEVFGQTSEGFPKKPHNIEINDNLGNDMAASLLGMPAEADWKLRNPYSDKCLMNDFLAYELFEQMGNYSCRRRFVEVFRNETGGKLNYTTNYYGVLVLLEKIERSKDRVDLAELTPAATNEPAISGGYMFKRDKDSGGDLNFTTVAGTPLKLHEPKPREVNNSTAHPQVVWLRNYLSQYETAVNAVDWTTRTGTNHYSHYIDVDAFVDSHWIVEFPKQIDGYRISNYFSKDRNGRVKNVPIWDWNLAFGNGNYLDGGHTNEWYYHRLGAGDHLWLRRLVGASPLPASGGDPDFIQKIIDRWGVLRTNVFNGSRLTARIDEIGTLLAESAGRNFIKYNYLNTYQWPNPNGPGRNDQAGNGNAQSQQRDWDVNYIQPTYAAIISEMKKWTMGRYLWIDEQFPKAPVFGLNPGPVAPGTALTLSAPGTVYYKLDGTDPRQAQANGAVAAGALTYSGPVTVNGNVRVFARARHNGVWSPPTLGTFVVAVPPLVISEIMYHPLPPTPGPGVTNIDEDFEYIEFKNTGASAFNVTGCRLSGGVEFTFPSLSIPAGGRVVVVKNQTAFTARYGGGAAVAGQYTGSLGNGGNHLVLEGALREPLLDFSYSDGWHPMTDGFGFSLVIVNDGAPRDTWGLAASWRPSGVLNGTPGQGDGAAPAFPQVVINEALTHSDPAPPTDTIELRNLSGGTADIGGWFLTDDRNTPKKFRLPNGTSIAAGGLLTFTELDFNTGANGNVPFALSSLGDEVYLFSGDASTNLTGYVQGFDFGAQFNGRTFGRHTISTGQDHFVALASSTLGGANTGPLVGPVVVSEVHYHPLDVVNGYGAFDNTEDEYIELHNLSGASVPLYDPAVPINRWLLRDAVEFTFPYTNLPAGGYALVVSFDPTNTAALAAFRANNGVGAGVPVFGPYLGKLDNSGDSVELVRPDAPTNGVVPYVLADKVNYGHDLPWPPEADGVGPSLQRVNESAYGNDPVNWAVGNKSPGASYVAGAVLEITQQPQNLSTLATLTASFSVAATGTPPISYQWYVNNVLMIGKTDSLLQLPNVSVAQAGTYRCLVQNSGVTKFSSNATLTVYTISTLPPGYETGGAGAPHLTAQPQNQTVLGTLTASFSVSASGTAPLSYQWVFGGTTITNATNATLVLPNVQPAQSGQYRCAVANVAGYAVSSNAMLTVTTPPSITQQPTNLFVKVPPDPQATNRGAIFRVTASSANPPLTYQWRVNSTNVPANDPNITGVTSNTLTLTNVSFENAGYYSCALTDGSGTIYTADAVLGVPPYLLHLSSPVTVAAGADISVNAVMQAFPPPFLYSWRRSSVVITNTATDSATNFATFNSTANGYTNTTGSLTNTFNLRLIFTNLATTATGVAPLNNGSFITVVADGDGDGIPDAIETALGLNPASGLDGALDPDGDGMSNTQEYNAGTDPANAASYLKIEQTTIPGAASVNFAAVSNRTYTVQFTDALPSAAWSKLADVLTRTTNRVEVFPDPAWTSNRFYRVVTPRQP